LFGASFTTFNAGLNGAGTLFTLNLYKPWALQKRLEVTERQLVRVAKRFELFICLAAMMVAPFLIFASRGFYQHVQLFSSLFSVPIFTIMAVGLLTKKVPAVAAKAGLCFFIVSYGLCQFVFTLQLHFLHITAILFVFTFLLMLIMGAWWPARIAIEAEASSRLNLAPWKNRYLISFLLIGVVVALFVIFSPLVLVK
jgi:SSS family solute:Na+ symporter